MPMYIWINVQYDDGTSDYDCVVAGAEMDENEPGEWDYTWDTKRIIKSFGVTVSPKPPHNWPVG